MLSDHLILCPPLHPLPSIFPSIRGFSNESALHITWPKYWCLSISPSNEYSWLVSFRIDLFDLLAVQGTLKSLLQHHSSKASILWHSAFFTVHSSIHWMFTHGLSYSLLYNSPLCEYRLSSSHFFGDHLEGLYLFLLFFVLLTFIEKSLLWALLSALLRHTRKAFIRTVLFKVQSAGK